MIIPCTQRIHLEYLGFVMVNLDKELARFDSIFRNIRDQKETICRSKIFIQSKRRERIRKRFHLLFLTEAGGGVVIVFMKSNH